LGSRGPGAQVDPAALCSLVSGGMVEVNAVLLTVLTARREMAYACLTDRAAALLRLN